MMSQPNQEISRLPDAPSLAVTGVWDSVFQDQARKGLEAALPGFIAPRRWFGSKARAISGVSLTEAIPILPTAYLAMLEVAYQEGEGETYVLPIGFAKGADAQRLVEERPAAVVARLQAGQQAGVLYDAIWEPRFCAALLDTIAEAKAYRGTSGELVASPAEVLPRLRGDTSEALPPTLLGVEQSNTSVRYGERLILKLYRRLAMGINPDQEIGQFLTSKGAFANTPPLAGVLEFRRREPGGMAEPMTVALLQGFVPNQGDAWRYTLNSLEDYLAAAHGAVNAPLQATFTHGSLLELVQGGVPADAEQHIGAYLESARLLGRRTAELHLALASDETDPVFAPEPFTSDFQSYLHRNMLELTDRILHLLRARLEDLSAADQREARRVLSLEEPIISRFAALQAQPIHALRTRIHGDYHLGQVLYTGDDFMIIDFEGEPARSLAERKMKRSPLQDVAGMLRSFHYAAYAAYFAHSGEGAADPALESWVRSWHLWVSVAYLKKYLEVADRAAFLPSSRDELGLLLDAYLVEKAVYELGYELNNRPTWASIPLQGILQTIAAGEGHEE